MLFSNFNLGDKLPHVYMNRSKIQKKSVSIAGLRPPITDRQPPTTFHIREVTVSGDRRAPFAERRAPNGRGRRKRR